MNNKQATVNVVKFLGHTPYAAGHKGLISKANPWSNSKGEHEKLNEKERRDLKASHLGLYRSHNHKLSVNNLYLNESTSIYNAANQWKTYLEMPN